MPTAHTTRKFDNVTPLKSGSGLSQTIWTTQRNVSRSPATHEGSSVFGRGGDLSFKPKLMASRLMRDA
jgi:hypothetical protein